MSGVVSESTRTYTVREGDVTKTVTERTVTTADGKTTTYREEKTEGGSGGGGGGFPSGFGNMDSKFGADRDAFMAKFNDMGGKSIQGGGCPASGGSKPSTQSGGGGAAPANMGEFRDQALKAHNERRKKHGVPNLKLSNDLNKYAQDWADHLIATGSFQHSNCQLGSERLGENIANKWSSSGADYTGEEVTEQWYSEISKHDYNSERSMGTGHFTQVVWKDSAELGIGKAQSKDGKCIVVASYRPAGNFIGNYTKNVFPPK